MRGNAELDAFGKSQAELWPTALKFGFTTSTCLLAFDELLATYDATAAKEGIVKSRRATAKYGATLTDSMREVIEEYAKEIRNRGDVGVVAQLNEQFYRPIKKFADDLAKPSPVGNCK